MTAVVEVPLELLLQGEHLVLQLPRQAHQLIILLPVERQAVDYWTQRDSCLHINTRVQISLPYKFLLVVTECVRVKYPLSQNCRIRNPPEGI